MIKHSNLTPLTGHSSIFIKALPHKKLKNDEKIDRNINFFCTYF